MAEGVVDLLEAVEVDEQHRGVGTRRHTLGDGLTDTVEDRGPVGELGQGVERRLAQRH